MLFTDCLETRERLAYASLVNRILVVDDNRDSAELLADLLLILRDFLRRDRQRWHPVDALVIHPKRARRLEQQAQRFLG